MPDTLDSAEDDHGKELFQQCKYPLRPGVRAVPRVADGAVFG